jgi:hypothetical protein
MRRFCICAVVVPSLLMAASPVQAKTTSIHRQKAHGDVVRVHAKQSPVTRAHKYTYGRT